MNRRSLWIVLGLTVAGLIAAAVLVWSFVLRPPLQVSDLHAGQRVNLRSGVTLTLPANASGNLSRWRSPEVRLNNPNGVADFLMLRLPDADGSRDAWAYVYWQKDPSSPIAMLQRGAHLLSRSPDGSVEVRWSTTPALDHTVYVITRLSGSRPGFLALSTNEVRDAASAWNAASTAWRQLHITNVQVPAPTL